MRLDEVLTSEADNREYNMPEFVKDALDVLIYEGEWSALNALSKHFGGDVFNYVSDHPDSPWK